LNVLNLLVITNKEWEKWLRGRKRPHRSAPSGWWPTSSFQEMGKSGER